MLLLLIKSWQLLLKNTSPTPGTPPPPALHIQPLLDIHLDPDYGGQMAPVSDINNIYLFSALALFIILLACINFMNLATARSQNRSKEVGVRKVIGATRPQLIRQFLAESMLLSGFALLLAVIIVHFTLPLFNQLSGKYIQLNYLQNPRIVAGYAGPYFICGPGSGHLSGVLFIGFPAGAGA